MMCAQTYQETKQVHVCTSKYPATIRHDMVLDDTFIDKKRGDPGGRHRAENGFS